MKIRYDFVTNSSSTSFVIISDGEFSFKQFIDAIGINDDSQFLDIYRELFKAFEYDMNPIRGYYEEYYSGKYSSFEEFVPEFFSKSKDLLPKILAAEKEGKKVFIGQLKSDNGEIESFFCTDEFIIESENLYIDAKENAW